MMHSSSRISFIRIAAGVLSIVCMVVIFIFSSENGEKSSETSGSITETVVEFIHVDYEELSTERQTEIYEEVQHFIRKSAHFLIYAALGFFVSCTLDSKKPHRRVYSLGKCFLYACSDELHQHFIPDRSGRFSDVLLDTSGSLTGILFLILCTYIVSRISSSKNKSVQHKTGSRQ